MYKDDIIRSIIQKVDVLRTKSGKDQETKMEIVKLINSLIGENGGNLLNNIVINETDFLTIPDVIVLPNYYDKFGKEFIEGNAKQLLYTIEIHSRMFKKYEAEEITAVIIHDILQNLCTTTARTRFLTVYNEIVSKIPDEQLTELDLKDDSEFSSIIYLMMMDIYARPFRIPVYEDSPIGADEVMINFNIEDAYNSYLTKYYAGHDLQNIDTLITKNLDYDAQTVKTIFEYAIVEKGIVNYYDEVKKALPSILITNPLDKSIKMIRTGNSRTTSINESFFKPSTIEDYRFKLDKIIMTSQTLESEDQRQAIIYDIHNLTKVIVKDLENTNRQLLKNPENKNLQDKKGNFMVYLRELDMLRKDIISKKITPKRYGLFIQYPDGYDY